ncbi:unnamed protein product, partial [Mesorhabditis spiculigera]
MAATEERRKSDLIKEIEIVLKAAVASLHSSKDPVSSDITQNLCNTVEAVFIHGLRDPFFLKGSRYAKYPEPNFWPFVSKLSHPGILNQIKALKLVQTEIGKGRAWIRCVLNEAALEHYIMLIKSDCADIERFYNEDAFLRDAEKMDCMRDFLKGMMSRCTIVSPTNSAVLNTWTPTPLILAGLSSGRPIRVGHLTRTKLPSTSEHDEVGQLATDLLPGVAQPQRIRRANMFQENESDDGSVYSHPSRMGGNLPFSSTPITGSPIYEPEQPAKILVVERRKKKQRKLGSRSNSNSESNQSASNSDLPQMASSVPVSASWNENLAKIDDTEISPVKKGDHSHQSETVDSGIYEFGRRPSESPKSKAINAGMEEAGQRIGADDVFNDSSGARSDILNACSPIENTDSCSDFGGGSLGSGSDSMGPIQPFGAALRNAVQSELLLDAEVPAADEGVAEVAEELDEGLTFAPSRKSTAPSMDMAVEVVSEALPEVVELEKPDDELRRRFLQIPNEVGLDAQDWRCPQCKRTIGCGYGRWKTCGLDALYYCADCFSAELRPIPSRVLLNWDHRPRAVSTRGKVYIDQHADEPFFRVDEMNPELYENVDEMRNIRATRERLQAVAMYLFSCRDQVADDLRRRAGTGSHHLVEQLHVYSYQDLLHVYSGVLEMHLQNLLKFAINHVAHCQLCRQKGFLCEMCSKGDVIYPFQEDTHRCQKCYGVFHATCWQEAASSGCRRCERRDQRVHRQPSQQTPFLD